MKELTVPFHRPSIGEAEISEVVDTLRSGWLTTGPRTAQFEREMSAYVQAPFALAVNSCTSGLHLAMTALGLGPGDEVITTPLTFCATVNTIIQVGAAPVLADLQEDGNIDPQSIRKRINRRSRAIVPVHIGGLPCNMDAIWSLAADQGLHVIEDAAHAISAHYNGFPIGAGDPSRGRFSDAVAFSFYATKSLTTGEGGMVTTHSGDLAQKMKTLCLHGISADAWNRYSDQGHWYYEVTACGFKYNLSDLQSAVGIHQLRRQEELRRKRAAIAQAYQDELSGIEEIELPQENLDSRHAWHLFVVRLNLDRLTVDRNRVIQLLRERQISASVHFIPIPIHPAYAGHAGLRKEHCPAAMELYKRILSLPIFPDMTREQVRYVADSLKDILTGARKNPAVLTTTAYSGLLA